MLNRIEQLYNTITVQMGARQGLEVENPHSSDHVSGGSTLSPAEPMRAGDIVPSHGIDSLPDVLMSLIFEEGKIDDSQYAMNHVYLSKYGYKERGRKRVPFPLIVSQVNRRWRGIAIQSHALWNRIVLSREHNEIASLFLERSQQCPIDIIIHLGMQDTVEQEPWLNHFDRCQSLSVLASHANVDDTVKTLQLFRDLSAPQLKSLFIDVKYDLVYSHEGYSNVPGRIFGGGAPALTNVKIRGISLPHCLPPLGAATRLSLDSWRAENIVIGVGDYSRTLGAIGRASSLTHLTLSELPLGSPTGRCRPVTLPGLISLKIIIPSAILEADDYCEYLFSSLILPNLDHLTLKFCHDYDLDAIITSTHNTRERHPSHLRVKSIALYDTKIDVWNIDVLSDLFPDVERLSISFGDDSDGVSLLEFLEEAEVGEDESYTLWPLLAQVCVVTSQDDPGEEGLESSLRAFVRSRKAVGLPLRCITVPAWAAVYDPAWYAEHDIDLRFCHDPERPLGS